MCIRDSHYTYNLKLKNKLVISHAILLMVPTAVVTGFLYARMYGIVMDDTIRSEQALATQTVGTIESLVDNAVHAGEVLARTGLVLDLFNVPLEQAGTHQPQRSRVDSLYRLASNLVDHSFITDIRIYYDDASYEDLSRYNQGRHPLFLPVSGPVSYTHLDVYKRQRSRPAVRHLLREILWQGQPAAKTHIMFQAAARQSGVGILPFPNPGAGLPLPVLILLQKIP